MHLGMKLIELYCLHNCHGHATRLSHIDSEHHTMAIFIGQREVVKEESGEKCQHSRGRSGMQSAAGVSSLQVNAIEGMDGHKGKEASLHVNRDASDSMERLIKGTSGTREERVTHLECA